MTMTRPSIRLAVSFAFVFSPLGAFAQSYGTNEQTLTVAAQSFVGAEAAFGTMDEAGYLTDEPTGAYSYYLAPLSLPDGAHVTRICAYVNDSDPGDFEWVNVYLHEIKLVPFGETSFVQDVAASFVSSQNGGDIGYGYYCTEPFDYVIRSRFDLDGDGMPDVVAHTVVAYVPHANVNAMGLGGVRITWKRSVSDAPASPTFADVPPSDSGFQYVEALIASGITAGCGGSNYCPDAPLTRRQMAVYLARALGLYWPN